MSRIRVLIVEDSPVVLEFLQYVIGSDPRLEVEAAATSAEEALKVLERMSPDVIALDIRLPGMNGFEATRRIMADKPTPIVLVSAGINPMDMDLTMRALQAGALAVLEKPVARGQQDYETLADRLCTQLAIMSQVKVVRQRQRAEYRPITAAGRAAQAGSYRLLALAASTGGPSALLDVLGGLGRDFPLPVAVVQHITPGFLRGFGDWLRTVAPLPVESVNDRAALTPGRIYVVGTDRHLTVTGSCVVAEAGEPQCAHRPSATVLFRSVARSLGPAALGVLLTGMGCDGADGLLEVRRAGGYTIAEDESTAVVYGMPAAAVKLGAVCESLPLCSVALRIRELVIRGAGGD